jgi:hypothetical protein
MRDAFLAETHNEHESIAPLTSIHSFREHAAVSQANGSLVGLGSALLLAVEAAVTLSPDWLDFIMRRFDWINVRK